jgi:hypothetical protein
VDYELTKRGSTLWQAVEPLSLWAHAHVGDSLKSREQFDQKILGSGKHPSSLPLPSRSACASVNEPTALARDGPRDSAGPRWPPVSGRAAATTSFILANLPLSRSLQNAPARYFLLSELNTVGLSRHGFFERISHV